jgi:hypothetical protein
MKGNEYPQRVIEEPAGKMPDGASNMPALPNATLFRL